MPSYLLCDIYIYIFVCICKHDLLFLLKGELSGFKDFIPPFAGASLERAHIGMNYASGAGGLREETSEHLVRSKNLIMINLYINENDNPIYK